MKRVALVCCSILLPYSAAWSASIGLFSTPDFTSCNLNTLPTGSGTFFIVAVDADGSICCGPGLSGVAFSIHGLPAGWATTITPSPQSNIAIGDPFTTDAHIAFPTYQFGYYILLYTVTVIPIHTGSSATLTVQAPLDPLPWSGGTYCPYRITNSDCPCDPNAACVDGGILYINTEGDCAVGVAPSTWTQVKRLFD